MLPRILVALALIITPALAQAQSQGTPSFSRLNLTGTGSTGDVSGMSVRPQGASGATALSGLLANAPQISSGTVSLLNGPTLGLWSGGKFLSYSDGRYTNRQLTWPNTYLPGFAPDPAYVTDYVVNTSGQNTARLSATRTSDITASGVQNTIASTALVVADSTDAQKLGWARYSQVNITAGSAAGLVLGEENSVENLSSYSVKIDPFSDVSPGSHVTANLRLTSGVGKPANDISTNLQILNNGGARSLSGIVIGAGALNTTSGYADAIAMPPGTGLSWYNGAGALGWRVFQNSFTGSGNLIFGNNTLDIYIGSSGEHPLAISTGQVAINDTLKVNGLIALNSYAVSGLPTCNASSKGSMTMATDVSAAPTYRQTGLAGGGSVAVPVFCNGSAWEAH